MRVLLRHKIRILCRISGLWFFLSNPNLAWAEAPPAPPGPAWRPVLAVGTLAGLDAGGSREELRDQNRVWSHGAAGLRTRDVPWGYLFPRLALVVGAEDDYRRTGPGHSQHMSGWVPAGMELGLGLYAPLRTPGTAWWGVPDEVAHTKALSFYIRAAAGQQRADPEGLFLAARLPIVAAGTAIGRGQEHLSVQVFGAGLSDVGAWDWAAAFRDRVVGSVLEFRHGPDRLSVMGAFERHPGDSALPALVLPLPGMPALFPGRAAARDEDVRTYGVRFSSDRRLRTTIAVFQQRGRSVAVTPDAGRSPFTARQVAAGAAYASLSYSRETGLPSDAGEANGECSVSPQAILCGVVPDVGAGFLGLALLAFSADRDSTDGKSHGFVGPASRPTVMGGPFSILLSGPGPGKERSPGLAVRSGNTLVDPVAVDPDRSRDRPKSRPDRENSGLGMGSLHFAASRPLGLTRLQLDIFGNYAHYLTGEGYEAVAVLGARMLTEHSLRILFSASVARYRSSTRQINVWTGLGEPAQTEYYRRFFLAAAWSY